MKILPYIASTLKEDFWTLKMAFKMAFYRIDRNPVYLAEIERMKREFHKRIEMNDKVRDMEREYGAVRHDRDIHEKDTLGCSDFIRKTAEDISFDLWPCSNNEMTKIEKDVERSYNNCRNPFLNMRFMLYVFILIEIINLLIKHFA